MADAKDGDAVEHERTEAMDMVLDPSTVPEPDTAHVSSMEDPDVVDHDDLLVGGDPDVESGAEAVGLGDGSGEEAGVMPEGDGAIESDDLSAITFTASDDDPETDVIDPEAGN